MLPFDNSYARDLPETYAPWQPAKPPQPALVYLNEPLAGALGLDVDLLRTYGAAWFSGAEVPPGATPIAQAYAGHQFGGLSPQLGDGRALLLGELVDAAGARRDLQLKGSGRTPFSRGGDGKAALGPMLREVIIGEALAALGVPTSRALAVTTTGERVRREGYPPGAVLARIAASHLRVGTFEFFAIRGDVEQLRRLVDYALARHYPGLDPGDRPALTLLGAVRSAQAALVARWMGAGFIHGVLNTDNVTISGEALDFGPCAFVEAHDPDAVFSSIDTHGRYAFGNQSTITGWNLAKLASALLPLVDDDEDRAVGRAQDALALWPAAWQAAWRTERQRKLGLTSDHPDDDAVLDGFWDLLLRAGPDHTLALRALGAAARGDDAPLRAVLGGGLADRLDAWLTAWRARLALDGPLDAAAARLDATNPRIIARNHQVEAALSAAVGGDYGPFERLVAAVRDPFAADGFEDLASPAPAAFTQGYQTFCGT
jgi:uncharacterized protein YdiU (UPF0061 family)